MTCRMYCELLIVCENCDCLLAWRKEGLIGFFAMKLWSLRTKNICVCQDQMSFPAICCQIHYIATLLPTLFTTFGSAQSNSPVVSVQLFLLEKNLQTHLLRVFHHIPTLLFSLLTGLVHPFLPEFFNLSFISLSLQMGTLAASLLLESHDLSSYPPSAPPLILLQERTRWLQRRMAWDWETKECRAGQEAHGRQDPKDCGRLAENNKKSVSDRYNTLLASGWLVVLQGRIVKRCKLVQLRFSDAVAGRAVSESEGVKSIKNVGGMLARCEEGLVLWLRTGVWAESSGGKPRRRRTLDGTGVTWYVSWSATCSAWTSLQCGTMLTRRGSARNERSFCWTSSVADAVSLIRTSSQKKRVETGWVELLFFFF